MSLKTLVLARDTGTFGTFEVAAGNVSKGRKPILQFFNGTTALIPMDARSNFTTPEEHAVFDETLMALSVALIGIQYVDSIGKFMDPKARFKDFIDGKLAPASVGLTLTDEELAVPSAYASAKQKFIDLFTPATPPRQFDPRPVGKREVLEVKNRSSKPYQIVTVDGYSIGIGAAKKLWDEKLKTAWGDRVATPSSVALTSAYTSASGYTDRRVMIYPTEIAIGCQTIQRHAIEAIAQQLGWEM